jgi:hypothetical protein
LAAAQNTLHEEVIVFNWLIDLSSSDDWSSLYEYNFSMDLLVAEVGIL